MSILPSIAGAAMPSAFLLAAGFDWLEAVLPFLFVLFWIVSQVFAIVRRVAGGAGAEPPRPPRPVPPRLPEAVGGRGQPDPPPVVDTRDALARQIEEFLRRTGREGPPVRPTRTAGPSPARPPALVPAAQTSGAAPRPSQEPLRAGQPRHVGALESQSTVVARHVEEVFSHGLDHLPPARVGQAAAAGDATTHAPSAAAELVRMIRDPATLRRAVLLRELLERPVGRW